ncbi:MAG: sulfatase [Alphaproteobacteria bacterium]|nr:sulfatase [Alphaproteobacteria bacterium]
MRSTVSTLGLLLAALLVPGTALCAAKPNIVVIMTDDQRDADPLERMPNTQALVVQHGVRFVNSYAVNPVCCASRASFLTGQYSHNDGVWDNRPAARPGGFKDFHGDDNTLACWAQQAGYRTALIGKYLNGYGKKASRNYIPPCWSYWWGLTRPFRYYDYEANDNGTIKTYGKSESDYQEDVVSDLAQQFIAGSTQPFFLWITGIAPHGGYPGVNVPVPPKRYRGFFKGLALPKPPNFNESDFQDKPKFMRKFLPLLDGPGVKLAAQSYRLRAETLLAADDMVGAIIAELEQRGLLSNTYVVFTSDNGFFNGEHRIAVGKHLLYDEALRVPLVIRGPAVPEAETRPQMVSNLDLSATIVELAGAAPGRTLDGRSLVPLLSSADVPWRTAMLLEGADVLPLAQDTTYGYWSAIRTGAYKYAEHVSNRERYAGNEFYDLASDPYEVNSRPDDPDYRQVVDQLKPMLAGLRGCQGADCWIDAILPASPPQSKAPPEIGRPCRLCRHRDLSRPLEPTESATTR